ncbi:hypothetical protein TDB9533_01573 [Thalassocella blandensis]|nr:hypothetical protein TDB9533_01573 [Thalassocella blandensis]
MKRYLTWDEAILQCRQGNQSWVLATVVDTHGSTPRNSGSKMVITADSIYDTIGGGQLEYRVIQTARELIAADDAAQRIEHFPLSAKANQCCGGTMSILLECFCTPKQQIHVFGAGHVAQALIPILSQLDVSLHWVDNRVDLFPKENTRNTHYRYYDNIIDHIQRMQPEAYAIVITHQHSLDYQLIEKLLDRKDCAYIGLIGSKIKANRFRQRLKQASFSQEEINTIVSPIGLLDIPGKRPIEVAVSIAAQIIQQLHVKTTSQKSEKLNKEEPGIEEAGIESPGIEAAEIKSPDEKRQTSPIKNLPILDSENPTPK